MDKQISPSLKFEPLIAELEQLIATWERSAKRRFEDAETEQNPMGRRLIIHGASCYLNCANELRTVMLKFQNLKIPGNHDN